jgi:hypothetical protein
VLLADGGFAITIDQIAESLRHDHVLVQEVIGSGDAQGTHDRLSRIIERLERDQGVTAYVALVMQPRDVDAGADSARYLTQALHTRLKQPGIYVVETTRSAMSVQTFGLPQVDDTVLDLLADANDDSVRQQVSDDYESVGDSPYLVPGVTAETALLTATHPLELDIAQYDAQADVSYPPTLTRTELDGLAERQLALSPPEPDDEHESEPLSTGARWMVGSAAGVSVLLVVQQTLLGWPGWRRRRARPTSGRPTSTITGPTPATLRKARARARAELNRLSIALGTADPGRPGQDPALVEAAAEAREAAERYVDSERLEEVAGAYSLAVTGRSDLARAADPTAPDRRLCFFDPLHGGASRTTSSALGDAQVGVPVCRHCARSVAAGRRPAALMVPGRVGPKPYYETDSVWARTGFGSIVDDYARQVLRERQRR